MLITDKETERYVELHTSGEPEVLTRLTRDTYLKILRPRMLSGNVQGQFLKMICQFVNAKRILEVGTYTGYSAISMAMALEEGGELHTIDNNDELEEFVHEYLEKSGVEDKVHLHVGDALELLPQIEGPFDVVFLDADKRQYKDYFNLVIDKVRSGGVIIADDVLWDGNIFDDTRTDPHTLAIKDFNDTIQADPRVENLLLPLRHGLMIMRKK